MRLTFEQSRVIGAMIEKAMTTPANYPMSLNAVVVACNQVSNRDPITEFSEAAAEQILRGLADDGLAKMVHRPGDRVVKYRHAFDDQLQTSAQETALLAVLMLRGPQTPGELRQRTGRYVEFQSLPELEEVLSALGHRQLVRRLDRQPGQKESRYQELLTGAVGGDSSGAVTAEGPIEAAAFGVDQTTMPPEPTVADEAVTGASDLRTEFDDLKRRFEALLELLGEDIPSGVAGAPTQDQAEDDPFDDGLPRGVDDVGVDSDRAP